LNGKFPSWVDKYPYRLDSIIPIILTSQGDALYADEIMSVWRKHREGMSLQFVRDGVGNLKSELNLAEALANYVGEKYVVESRRRCSYIYTEAVILLLKSGRIFEFPTLLLKAIFKMDYRLAWNTVKTRIVGRS
jgi:hypothetical protein